MGTVIWPIGSGVAVSAGFKRTKLSPTTNVTKSKTQ